MWFVFFDLQIILRFGGLTRAGRTLAFEGRWANEFHLVSAKKCCVLYGRIWDSGGAEKLLHLARGSESDQHAPRLWALRSKGVRDVTGRKDGLSRAETLAVFADLKDDVALDDVEPLLLMEVQVKRRTTFYEIGVFDDEEAAGCFAGGNFEEYLAESARMRLAEAVLARTDNVNGVRRRSDCGLREGEILQRCGWEQSGCGLEE
jgi:hypothetical protein